LRGDQRKWHVPCPLCGDFIILEWKQIKFDKDNIENTIRYECQSCGDSFKEKHKYDINLQGQWIPTAKPERSGYYSYHITALTSAPHMYGWDHYAYQWKKIHQNNNTSVSKLKVFTNLVLGEPWEEKKQAVKKNVLAKNTRSYQIGIVPTKKSIEDGSGQIVLLTCACDINGTKEDGRLDYEVVAWSETGSSYSVDAGSIGTYQMGKGKENRDLWTYENTAVHNNIWNYFYENVINREYPTEDKTVLKIIRTAIDVGHLDQLCWKFINEHKTQCFGVKGEGKNKYIKPGADIKTFKPARERANSYILQVDIIKDRLAENIALQWKDGNSQPPGFMNFPEPSQGKYLVKKYFAQYETEKKEVELSDDGEIIGYKWTRKNTHAANHFFDVAVYNLAVKDIFVWLISKELKKQDFTWFDWVELFKSY